jgi:hypothetical protein
MSNNWVVYEPNLGKLPSVPRIYGGKIIFGGNQVTLYLDNEQPQFNGVSCFILSGGDASVQGNQIEMEGVLSSEAIGVNTGLVARTLRVGNNLFKEPPLAQKANFFSAITYGEVLNSTNSNQASHCIRVSGPPGRTVDSGNLALQCPFSDEEKQPSVSTETRSITGRVVTDYYWYVSLNQREVQGARVWVKGRPQVRTVTDDNGEFLLDGVPINPVVLQADLSFNVWFYEHEIEGEEIVADDQSQVLISLH